MRNLIVIGLVLCGFIALGQERREAEVTYLNSQSVYLRFENTDGINEGDTLYNSSDNSPCLQVQRVSSVSCLAIRIGNCEPVKGQKFYILKEASKTVEEETETTAPSSPQVIESAADSLSRISQSPELKTRKRDKGFLNLGFSSAATLNDANRQNYRSLMRSSLRVDSLFGKDLSLEAYGNLQSFRRGYASSADDYRANIYNLALVYQPVESQRIVLGRRINPRVASLGAIDGLQWEGSWGNWSAGAILGSRPDFGNYAYNFNLMQYGAYGAYDWHKGKQSGALSLGLMQQTNQGAIDRRYIYTQQSYRWSRLYVFASAEVDLYENFDTAQAANTFRLSSLYLSARYRLSNRWTLFASYDSRQQIIFFERYDSEIERLLAEQGAREGIRLRSDYRFWKSTHLGLSYNLRTNPTFGNNSQNLQASISQHRLPWIGGSLIYRFNINRNGNLNSEINSLRYSRNIQSKSRVSAYYRYVSMAYALREINLDPQHFYGLEYSHQFGNQWNLGIMGEYSMIHQQDQIRVYLRVNKRLKF
jgi:hypothetical protein